MVRRILGRTGLSVSAVGLGTTKLGRNTDVKYPHHFELPSDREVHALIEATSEAGINLIDTAPAYGLSEQRLGPFIKRDRDRWIICTKCGETYDQAGSKWDFSAAAIVCSLETSLRSLKTDHVDILLLHSDGRDLQILTETDALEALADAKRSGKARAIGISAKTAAGINEACRSLDVIMAPFSQSEDTLKATLDNAHQAGLGTLGIKGLGSGRLAPAQAIEFVLRQHFIDALLIGTTSPKHLREAAKAAEKLVAPDTQTR